jgi:DNA helicase II / ATP-dependent DNA helicase PcrA
MILLQELNSSQRDAVRATSGPVMVVAGAGSGKTRVLTYRIAYLLKQGIHPGKILALTFTNKAANEMKNRINTLLKSERAIPWMGTFHSVFARILRQEAHLVGYHRSYSIYDTEDALGLVRSIMNDLNISQQQYHPKAILNTLSSAKNRLLPPDQMLKHSQSIFEEKTVLVYKEYVRRLKLNNAMDFDDLITLPIMLFKKNPDVLGKWQSRFEYILVDEYQDTNHAQYCLLNLLAQKRKNICVVGDDAQSIYAFRGADIRNILDFERDYPNCTMFRLEQNYRSTKFILRAADSVIKNNHQRIPKTLWTENGEGEPVHIIECANEQEEGIRVARLIQDELHKSKRDFNHFVVLYRTNAQSRSIEDGLRRSEIPYTIVGGVEFYKRKEIKDVIAYLRVIVNPVDDESMLRIINFPARGIGNTTINRLRSIAREHDVPFLDACKQIDQIPRVNRIARTGVHNLVALIKKYRDLHEHDRMSASELARSLIEETGILDIFKQESTPESISRWENIQELLSAITEFSEENPGKGLTDFLETVSLIADVDKWNDTRNAVTLMTFHSAKGLEFPVVIMAGMEDGLFPLYNGYPESEELEEERRLCYVGMTRAREQLYMTFTRYRYRYGEGYYPVPSRFLEEIDPGLSIRHVQQAAGGWNHDPSAGDKRRLFLRSSPADKTRRGFKHRERTEPHYSYENESQVVPHLRIGSLVEHEDFGRGKVLALSGKGDLMKAVVSFDSAGKKSLMLKFARLKIL